jgi:NitT/TauT family transport system ATP-binding protein
MRLRRADHLDTRSRNNSEPADHLASPHADGIEIANAAKIFWSYKQGWLTKLQYNPVPVFSDVDLRINPGEFVSLVGPTGCGKTTLLRCTAGLESLSAGTITIGSKPVVRPSMSAAMVFQSPALLPWLTVERNVATAFTMRGSQRLSANQKHNVAAYIHLVGLDGAQHRYPHQLSGGMQQRVGIARALVGNPNVLLMDEPFGALDAQTRTVMQAELIRIFEEIKCTVFFITHDLEEALILSDQVMVMSGKPAGLTKQIHVPWERPRSIETVRSDPRFELMRRELWTALRRDDSQELG